ncbi:MAG TPA: Fe-S cluster assembly scaffold SufA [Alphaproteobacteria bacterium]|nr:Fe-S cluster assembly scaffold SufA [Alphaproteobacteria bacterium]
MKAPITISDNAAERIKHLMEQRAEPAQGIRVGVKKGGCSGLAYTIEYADNIAKFDEVVEDKGVKVIIDPKATMYLIGTEMDFVEEKMKSGFVFKNPNEKGRCGCGESFTV